MRDATFKMIYFPKLDRYVAVAWNYDLAILFSTPDFPTYTEARNHLSKMAADMAVSLRWFDGEYYYENGYCFPKI